MDKKYTHITPAILPKSFEDLVEHLDTINALVPIVQIDVVDGKFAPNKTWPYTQGIQSTDRKFLSIVNQEEGLPYWESLDFEIDLMVSDPVFVANQWIAAGARRVVVHVRSLTEAEFVKLAREVHDKGVELYMGVEIEGEETAKQYISALEKNVGHTVVGPKNIISGIQCMGIDRVGFQHQKFNPQVLQVVQNFRGLYKDVAITVDGGVSLETAGPLFDAGTTTLVSGSAVFESQNIIDTLEHFEEIYEA